MLKMFNIGNDEITLAEPNAYGDVDNLYLHIFDKGTPSEAVKLDSYFTEYIECIYNTFENQIDFTAEKSLNNILDSQTTHLKNDAWQTYIERLS
jgi:hypothetical protein